MRQAGRQVTIRRLEEERRLGQAGHAEKALRYRGDMQAVVMTGGGD